MKLKIQAQHLQPGDIVGSGEVINRVTAISTEFSSTKVRVYLNKNGELYRIKLWGKYTMINVERKEKENV